MPNLLSAPSTSGFNPSSAGSPTPFLKSAIGSLNANTQGAKPGQGLNTNVSPLSMGTLNLGAGNVTGNTTSSLGTRAAAPGNNVTAPSNSLPSLMTAPQSQQPVPQQTQTNGGTSLPTNNPNAAFNNNVSGTAGTQNNPSSVVNLLNNFANTNPTGAYTQQLAQTGTQLQPLVQPAIQTANSDLQKAQQAALASETLETTGGPSAPLLGNALAQQQLGQNFQNLATAAGGLATSGVTGQQAGLNQAGTLAYQGQQTQQNAATSLLSNMPQALQYGAYGATGLGNLSPQAALQSAAQNLANNTGGLGYNGEYQQLSAAFGPAIANNLLSSTLAINPNFNAAQSTGGAAGSQQVAQTGGTAVQSANQNVLNTATQSLADYTNTANNISSLGSQAIQALSDPNIAKFDSNWANRTVNQIMTQYGSSPAYAKLNTALQGLVSSAAALINTRQDLGSSSAIASSLADGSTTLGTLNSVVNQLTSEAGALVSNQKQIVNSATQAVQNGNGTAGTSATSGWGSLGD